MFFDAFYAEPLASDAISVCTNHLFIKLVPTLVETMSYSFPEIKANQEHIQRVIKGEEESFNATLDNGLKIFEEIIAKPETIEFKNNFR